MFTTHIIHRSSTYVSSQKLHTIAERLSVNETSLQGADKALVYSALAIGCDCPNSLERQAEATSYHKAAADQSWSVVVGAPSITKLQVSILMTFVIYQLMKLGLGHNGKLGCSLVQVLGKLTEAGFGLTGF